MTKKQQNEESDNENNFDNENDEDIENELSEDELNDENDYDSQLMSDDKDNIDIEYIEDNYTINNSISKKEYLVGDDRISSNRLTKYEMVRILGERVKQLIMGAKPMIKNYKELSYEEIAEHELINNTIPFKIRRPLPNGKYEIWTLDELSKDHL